MTRNKKVKYAKRIIEHSISLGGAAIVTGISSKAVGDVGGPTAAYGQTGLMNVAKAYPAYGSIAGAAIGTDLIQGAFVKPKRKSMRGLF